MLDNMSHELMKEAVDRIKARSPHVIVEASGGVTLDTVRAIAACGVDVISVGGLTYSFQALDISLDLNGKKGGTGCVILVVDVGNTNIVLGIYEGRRLASPLAAKHEPVRNCG